MLRIGIDIEIHELVVFVLVRTQIFIAHAQVQSKTRGHLPVILKVSGPQVRPRFNPRGSAEITTIDSAEKEIRNRASPGGSE